MNLFINVPLGESISIAMKTLPSEIDDIVLHMVNSSVQLDVMLSNALRPIRDFE